MQEANQKVRWLPPALVLCTASPSRRGGQCGKSGHLRPQGHLQGLHLERALLEKAGVWPGARLTLLAEERGQSWAPFFEIKSNKGIGPNDKASQVRPDQKVLTSEIQQLRQWFCDEKVTCQRTREALLYTPEPRPAVPSCLWSLLIYKKPPGRGLQGMENLQVALLVLGTSNRKQTG